MSAPCPECGKVPEAKFSEPHGVFLVFCCRYQAGSYSAEEAEKVWDQLVEHNKPRAKIPAR